MPANPILGSALLFCPADRPDRYAKALAVADVVVIDLEDAVAPDARAGAREALVSNPVDPARVIVRVNASTTSDHALDVAALGDTQYRTVMLAKTETVGQVQSLAPLGVVALCETPRGVLAAERIAATPNVVGLMWGSEDLVAALGGQTSRRAGGSFRFVADHARAAVLLAAKAHGRFAVDAVWPDFSDLAGLTGEVREAAACGYDLKACIHPSQVTAVREAFRPSAADVEHARRVLEAAAGGGVVALDGQMIDGPLVSQARRILQRAGVAPATSQVSP